MRHVSMLPKTDEPYYRERMRKREAEWRALARWRAELDVANRQAASMLQQREAALNPIVRVVG